MVFEYGPGTFLALENRAPFQTAKTQLPQRFPTKSQDGEKAKEVRRRIVQRQPVAVPRQKKKLGESRPRRNGRLQSAYIGEANDDGEAIA